MKERLMKKAEKARRRDIHRLLDLALDINGLGERKRSVTGCRPTVFFEYSGHVAKIRVDVHRYGWEPDQGPDFCVSAYTDGSAGLCDAVRELEGCIAGERIVG